jgi:DNA-binding GntR family transcriptional regulator
MSGEKKQTSMELARSKIINKIMTERLKPGTPLRELHLAAEFGISATPVREAFRKLEHEGWLESVPRRGCRIRAFTRDEIYDIYLLREALECVAAGQAARRGDKESFARLNAALESEKAYIDSLPADSGDFPPPPLDPDMDFHSALFRASGSAMLAGQCDTLGVQLNTIALATNIKTSLEEIKTAYREHCLICEAVGRGWIKGAEELVRAHISSARDSHLKKLAAAQ